MTFDDEGVRSAWERGAEAWKEFVRSGADYYRTEVHGPALLSACEVRPGVAALDLGCGEGYFSRALARAGAIVTGIDITPTMLAFAREEEAREPLGIHYLQASATDLSRHFAERQFELVAACMSVQDVSDPGACLAGAARVIRPRGRIVISVPHPATDMPVREWNRDAQRRKLSLSVDRYFDTGPAECEWTMDRLSCQWVTPYWRRTLEEWSAMIASAGLVVDRMFEPQPPPSIVALRPELDDCVRLPYFLIFRLIRRSA
jgi:2-polyprenyl-3-methyl-5-hydroxy-6-metoxy-1,4-benzoquinol methylase